MLIPYCSLEAFDPTNSHIDLSGMTHEEKYCSVWTRALESVPKERKAKQSMWKPPPIHDTFCMNYTYCKGMFPPLIIVNQQSYLQKSEHPLLQTLLPQQNESDWTGEDPCSGESDWRNLVTGFVFKALRLKKWTFNISLKINFAVAWEVPV